MVRVIPPSRFDDLLRVAREIFISQGYTRTQMDDVAKAMGLGKGTIYGYVESKQALFDFVVRHTAELGTVPVPAALPWPTPTPGSTVRFVQERIAQEWKMPALESALVARRVPKGGARRELEVIIREFYALLYRNRHSIKLLERCSRDYPELDAMWHSAGRYAAVGALEKYIVKRVRSGHFLSVPDARVAARFFQETLTTWAVHIHWDPAPDDIDEDIVLETVLLALTRALVKPNLMEDSRAQG